MCPSRRYAGFRHIPTLTRTKTPSYLLFVDTETRREYDSREGIYRHFLRLGVLRFVYIRNKDKITEDWFTFRTVGDFWDYVFSKAESKKVLWILAHNWHFDFQVLDGFRVLKNADYKLHIFIPDSQRFIVKAVRNQAKLLFVDTTNYFKASVAELGRLVGLKKYDIDFENAEDIELEFRCRRDVEIISEAFLRLLRWWRERDLGRFGYTIASLAFNAYRKNYMTERIYTTPQEFYSLERAAYYGGRVEAFRLGHIAGDVYHLDVNSMYPHVMSHFRYPVKAEAYKENVDINTLEALLFYSSNDNSKVYGAICEVCIETNEPVYPKRLHKLIFPVGRFCTYLSTEELKYAIWYRHVREIRRCIFYRLRDIFSGYVIDFYELKRRAELEGDYVTREFAKLLLNSLYGKFGQKVGKLEHIGYAPDCKYVVSSYRNPETGERGRIYQLCNELYAINSEGQRWKWGNVAIAAHVTANARLWLWHLIKTAGLENVIYVDTDSLFVTCDGYERLRDYVGDGLGALKFEGVYTNFHVYGPKDYKTDKVRKVKGVPKSAEAASDRVYVYFSFMKTRTALSKGVLGHVVEMPQVKFRSAVYDKRIVHADGTTEPIQLSEF